MTNQLFIFSQCSQLLETRLGSPITNEIVASLYLSRDILISRDVCVDISYYDPSSLFGNLSDSAVIIVNIERLNSDVGSSPFPTRLTNICVFNILYF